ncbi:ABC transporter ATP-binding protein [Oceanirhabdus sp. W0125-5]|uniref:ABC transporter ATP-binding protein n=1 Tax=Oceanirhabdus sp. W0125-5 TaxID=2999116 RepID=UPI0022F3054D|nr:ABC transporter ATP-binding protein [Oceanirhabdus sp. W0125-5]WBW99058.1 ABC transporter ATP-binding protein [Oceanirhabdus sp. W0125-5]
MLEVNNLTLAYDNNVIVDDMNFKIEKGKIISLIGANGCGKSTLLKSLSRNLKPKKGAVYLDGEALVKMDTKLLAKRMSILPQMPKAPDDFTARDLVSFGRYPYTGISGKLSKKDLEVVDWAIKETKMNHLQHRQVMTLSGGERQRAWIALALAQQPEVLMLDEPTTFLDICYQYEVLELINRLNKEFGITIIMVLHDLNQAARYSHEIIVMKDKNIYKRGKPKDIINEDLLKDVFNLKAKIFYDEENDSPYFLPLGIV